MWARLPGPDFCLPSTGSAGTTKLATLAAQSVGVSHPSYAFDGRQWALAIDAATPVAAFRPDLLAQAPRDWAGVMALARQGRVGFALIPINALMTFMGLARNLGASVAEDAGLPRPRGGRRGAGASGRDHAAP